MITSKDVANKAGVSVSTVSRVFSNPKMISEKARTKVLKAAEELHYIPNTTARNLKMNISNTFGVIVSDSENPFYLKVVREFNRLPSNKDIKTLIMFSEEDSEKEYSDIISLVSSKVQSIMFTPTSESNEKIETLLISNQIPALQLYRKKFNAIDSLIMDDGYGTYLATKELIQNGHKNIVLLDYKLSIPTHRDDGYKKAFQEAGLEYDQKNIIKFSFEDDFYGVIYNLLKNRKHTAYIPTGDKMIHTLCRCLGDLDLKIKEDVSVIAYDDVTMAKYINLSAVSHPFQEIASTANKIIQNRIEYPDSKPQEVYLKPFLIKRDSVKNIK